jgi:NADH-quinone oxidoreductase subunit F
MQVQSQLDTILARYTGRGRDYLLPVLWDVQTAYGYIGKEAVHDISHTLRVPEADIYGVISFYTLFHSEPTGETIIRVCTDPSCSLRGADAVLDGVCQTVGVYHGETSADGKYTVEHSPCLGLCELAPAALVSKRGVGELSVGNATVENLLADDLPDYASAAYSDMGILLDSSDLSNLAAYGDYQALRHVLSNVSPDNLIAEIEASGLIGRGGAAFPTGMKWKFTRRSEANPKYVVCNADESEPGTFKDRILMETRPHLLLEGMALAAYAIGAEKGYLFIRGEYPKATKIMQEAIASAEAVNLLGANIMGTNFSFHVEIRRGAGAYICGEETALFEAIEGKRGFPRIKPPYPTTNGLFDKPTVINNVETLCTVPYIVQQGAEWFKGLGTEKSTGSKLVSVSGHVHRAGVYEIEPGLTLRELLENYCQGIDGNLQAVLMGGAAGTFLTPDEIDVRLTFEDLRSIGSTFGSGAIMVFNDTVDLRDILRRLAVFFQHESCGKCFPCQLGTQRQLEILQRTHQPIAGDTVRLRDIGLTMTEASLCGLGQTAASAILSAMEKFPHLFAV